MSASEPSSRAARLVHGGLDAIDWIVGALVVLAMAVMTITVAVQVGLRYGLNDSLDWADEVSRLAFVWAVFLAIPLGVRRGAHVGIELLTAWLPPGPRRGLFRLVSLLALGLMAVVAWQAAILVRDQWDEPMSTLDVSIGLFMLPLATGAVHSVLHLLVGAVSGRPGRTVATAEVAATE
jgi:TRAP-type C4-dicarboxylate transport system permease small subunit